MSYRTTNPVQSPKRRWSRTRMDWIAMGVTCIMTAALSALAFNVASELASPEQSNSPARAVQSAPECPALDTYAATLGGYAEQAELLASRDQLNGQDAAYNLAQYAEWAEMIADKC